MTEFNSLNSVATKIAMKLRFTGLVIPVFQCPYFKNKATNNTISFIWIVVHWPDFSSKSTGIKSSYKSIEYIYCIGWDIEGKS